MSDLDAWISSINGRLSIIESIINEKEAKAMIAEVAAIQRIIHGDPDLNVPPLYDVIENLSRTTDSLKRYQEKDIKYRQEMRRFVNGIISKSVLKMNLTTAATIKEYQEENIKYRQDIKVSIVAIASLNIITLLVAIMGLLS